MLGLPHFNAATEKHNEHVTSQATEKHFRSPARVVYIARQTMRHTTTNVATSCRTSQTGCRVSANGHGFDLNQ